MNYRSLQDSDDQNKTVGWYHLTRAKSTFQNLMSNISPPLGPQKVGDFSCGSDLSDRPGGRGGHRGAGKTPTHPGHGDPASGVWGEQAVLGSVQVPLSHARSEDICPWNAQTYLGHGNN